MNISFPEKYWYEDMVTRTLIYPICKNVVYIAEPLYNKREHAGNASKIVWNKNIKCMDQIFLTRSIQEEQKKLGYALQNEDIHALIYEYSYMASKRVMSQYLHEAYSCSNEAVLDLLKSKNVDLTEFNDVEKQFIKSMKTNDYRLYSVVMKKMRLLDMDVS